MSRGGRRDEDTGLVTSVEVSVPEFARGNPVVFDLRDGAVARSRLGNIESDERERSLSNFTLGASVSSGLPRRDRVDAGLEESGGNASVSYLVRQPPAITGTIRLQGEPPPERPLPMDPACVRTGGGAEAESPRMTRFFMVGTNRGLADVVVWLVTPAKYLRFDGSLPNVKIEQKGCVYHPYVSVCQVGQEILVLNSDPVLHNVHTTPLDPLNREDNKAQLPGAPALRFSFPAPEEFLRFKCDVHPWMFSYVTIVATPFSAVTDMNGRFAIRGRPAPGEYVLKVKHRKLDGLNRRITILADGTTMSDFEFV